LFENKVLGRIFGPKRDEVTGSWKELHNEELHGLYSAPNIIRVVKSRMRLAELVERMRAMRSKYKILVGKPEWKGPPEDVDLDERIILKRILGKSRFGCGFDSSDSG
jgi:hypothetical protein